MRAVSREALRTTSRTGFSAPRLRRGSTSRRLTLEGEQSEDRIEHKGRCQEREEDERQRVER